MGCCKTNRTNNELELKMNNLFKLDRFSEQENIIKKAEKCVCKINKIKGGTGPGFLCNIPFPNNDKLLPVLITSNNTLNKNDINEGKRIDISLNNDSTPYAIMIDENRKKYNNSRSFGITIIEIKKEDGLDTDLFFEIDENIYENRLNDEYKDKQIYLIEYSLEENIHYSNGLLKSIEEDNIYFIYSCQNIGESCGCPLLKSSNNKVMGIQKGKVDNEELNKGILIKIPIEKFYDKNS